MVQGLKEQAIQECPNCGWPALWVLWLNDLRGGDWFASRYGVGELLCTRCGRDVRLCKDREDRVASAVAREVGQRRLLVKVDRRQWRAAVWRERIGGVLWGRDGGVC